MNIKLKAETAYIKHVITKIHPDGFISLVCDSYDFWGILGYSMEKLKQTIMSRNGRLVIRPDSGDPVLIMCGDPDGKTELERKGAVEALWDVFGGTITPQGYKVLDSHIGVIYGDAITLKRCEEICERLKTKGFASTNAIFGIGSYTYQYNTRDTFGFALKSTACVIDGVEKQIFKDPKTDNGIKKSQKGRVAVLKKDDYEVIDGLSLNDTVSSDCLTEVFRDGKLLKEYTLKQIKERLQNERY